MIAAVNDGNQPIDTSSARYFDRKNYLTWLAVNLLTRNLDTTSQNFYLAASADSDVWTFVPWDYDGGWGFYEQPNEAAGFLPRWRSGLANWWAATLHRRFLSVPANLQQFKDRRGPAGQRVLHRRADQGPHRRLQAARVGRPSTRRPTCRALPTSAADKMQGWEAEVDRLLTSSPPRRPAFTKGAAMARIHTSCELVHNFPATLRALEEGRLTERAAFAIVRELSVLDDPDARRAAETALLEWAGKHPLQKIKQEAQREGCLVVAGRAEQVTCAGDG